MQQVESSRLKLAQIEQELQQVHQQGVFVAIGVTADHGRSVAGNSSSGALTFDMDYARWVDEHQRLINGIRSAINSQMGDNELHLLVDSVITHYDELYRLKRIGAKADMFHILSGLWITPAERCFMWLGGNHSSELLKIVRNHLDPLTDQQLMGIYNLQRSSQQAEDALSQGTEAEEHNLLQKGWCPYFLARHMVQFANVVVYSYQYLLDPKVAAMISKEMQKESVVVFDEAHNIDNVCIGALSVSVRRQTIDGARRNVNRMRQEIDKFKATDAGRLRVEYNKLVEGLALREDLPAADGFA